MTKSLQFIAFTTMIFSALLLVGLAIPYEISKTPDFLGIDIRLLVMFLLAEPHFAMTIPLLYGYRHNFYRKKTEYIAIPLGVIILAALIFYSSFVLFSIIFLLANVYHVNRQSQAFLMLQTSTKKQFASVYEWLLHLSVIIFFGLRFLEIGNKITLLIILLLFLLISSTIFWKQVVKTEIDIKKHLSFIQGFLIFLPIVIFEDLLLAFAIGISIHYLQYLSISWPVCRKSFGWSAVALIAFLLGYSLLSSGALGGFIVDTKLSLIILIPTTLQLLHFYFDGLIWKRSDPLISETLITSTS